jgi:ribosomal protein S7
MQVSLILRFDLEDPARRAAIDAFVEALEASRPDEFEGTISMGGAELVVFLEVKVRHQAEVEARVLPEYTALIAKAGLADVGSAERPKEEDDDDQGDDDSED